MTDSRLSLRESTCPQSKPAALAGSPTVLAAILALLCSLPPACLAQPAAESPTLRSLSGRTMGTTYTVKVFGGPSVDTDLTFAIDAELRRINDQMSTYLKSSEISKFNASESTDWFDVSQEFAEVVDFAQQVSQKTNGAFDVTVGPLVNAWSFGPDPKTNQIPADSELEKLRESVGFEKLSVRLDPPAIRKSIPALKIDLSAIAKGHAVDRLVQLLATKGATNVFVEIGGEVRTRGDKGGQPWKVGIQMPDTAADTVMIAHAMGGGTGADEAMATSGDYRNYFEVDGKRYSHTIDPRNGKPVDHELASVTVVTASCMAADAWATAINVLGNPAGIALANRESLSTLLVRRFGDDYAVSGTGTLAQYAANQPASQDAPANADASVVPVMVLAFGVFAVLICAMAVGVMFGRKPIAGSCGGLNNPPNEEGAVSCSMCSNPADACKELRERMKGKDASTAEG
jgi:thiamine biosynthesis lipoprotein